jgi:hypothetical protein
MKTAMAICMAWLLMRGLAARRKAAMKYIAVDEMHQKRRRMPEAIAFKR